FGFFATALLWRGRGRELLLIVPPAALALIAHPQGFVWLIGCIGYVFMWRALRGRWKLVVPAAAVLAVLVARHYLMLHYQAYSVWGMYGPGVYNGSDQIALYSMRYYVLSGVALLFGVICFAVEAIRRYWGRISWADLRLPLELHLFVFFAIYRFPDVLRLPLYQ